MLKKELRTIFLSKRNNLSSETISKSEELLLENLINYIRKHPVKVVHIFLPISSKNEINTSKIIEWFWSKKIKTVVPVSNFDNHTMDSYEFSKRTSLENNKWGIPEPVNSVKLASNLEIDLVITPLIVADKNGHRVGYGKGFYDRFFSTCKPTCQKIGLSFFEPVDVISDFNEHDIRLNTLITPKKIHEF